MDRRSKSSCIQEDKYDDDVSRCRMIKMSSSTSTKSSNNNSIAKMRQFTATIEALLLFIVCLTALLSHHHQFVVATGEVEDEFESLRLEPSILSMSQAVDPLLTMASESVPSHQQQLFDEGTKYDEITVNNNNVTTTTATTPTPLPPYATPLVGHMFTVSRLQVANASGAEISDAAGLAASQPINNLTESTFSLPFDFPRNSAADFNLTRSTNNYGERRTTATTHLQTPAPVVTLEPTVAVVAASNLTADMIIAAESSESELTGDSGHQKVVRQQQDGGNQLFDGGETLASTIPASTSPGGPLTWPPVGDQFLVDGQHLLADVTSKLLATAGLEVNKAPLNSEVKPLSQEDTDQEQVWQDTDTAVAESKAQKQPPVYRSAPKQISELAEIKRGPSVSDAHQSKTMRAFVAEIEPMKKAGDLHAAADHYKSRKHKKKKKVKKVKVYYYKRKKTKKKKKQVSYKHKPKPYHHYHHQPAQHDHGKYYEYRSVPKKGAWKFGYKRGNKKHTVERKEHGYKSHFKTEVKWKDKKGKGHHIFDYNHGDHKKKKHHHYHAAASAAKPKAKSLGAKPARVGNTNTGK